MLNPLHPIFTTNGAHSGKAKFTRYYNLQLMMNNKYSNIMQNTLHPMSKLSQIRRDLKKKGKTLFDFSLGDSFESTPSEILESLKKSVSPENRYPRTRGNKELRIICSNYLYRRYAIKINPYNEIAITSGSKEAIFHFPFSLKQSNEKRKYIIYGTPSYPGYESGCMYTGFSGYPIQLSEENNFLLPFWSIPHSILNRTKLIWINYPHNPTGTVADINYLKELSAFCQQYEIIIASDDCYADLWHNSSPPTIAQFTLKNMISFHSCSKRSNMAGLRSGFMFGDSYLISKYLSHRVNFGNDSSTIIQKASEIAWSDDNHVTKIRNSIATKAQILMNRLNEIGIRFPTYSAGIFLFGKLPSKVTDIEYFEKCLNNDILVVPSRFLKGPTNFIRISLSPKMSTIETSLRNWPTIF